MDAILDLPASLPPHDPAPRELVPASVVAIWPVGTFVENLCPLEDGSFAVSVLSEARVDRIWADGRRDVLIQFDAPPTGIVRIEHSLYVTVGVPDEPHWTLWAIPMNGDAPTALFQIENALFLNGLAWLAPGVLLSCDSATGCLLRIDIEKQSTAIWIADERLTRSPDALFLPGANGVKCFNGAAFVTSNSRALLCRIPIKANGSAGRLEIIAERLRADDLAIDTEGNLYLATHIGHSVDRLTPGGKRTTIGSVEQGLAGSTACAFGVTAEDKSVLYVTTTGGIVGPYKGVLQPARIVRLDVNALGASLGG